MKSLPFPESFSARRALLASLSALVFVGTATGCGQSLSVKNQPAHIDSVGPVQVDAASGQVSIYYTLEDREGDDQQITVEICQFDGSQDSQCGFPVRGSGGDGTAFVPTLPAATKVKHLFRWRLGCGRFVGNERIPSRLQTSYRARISIDGSKKFSSSEPFKLAGQLDSIPACP